MLKFHSSHWLKLQSSDWRANLVEVFFLQINFPPMRALQFITDHVIFKLRYDQIYQMKTTQETYECVMEIMKRFDDGDIVCDTCKPACQ